MQASEQIGNSMNNETIETIQDAEEFFKAMGCSHFHMARDDPQRYNQYKDFNISEQIETGWRTEKFNDYYNNIMKGTSNIELWNIHSVMYELLEFLRTEETLAKMLEVTQNMRDKVPVRDRIIVAETINGRAGGKTRSGLIYLAHDLKNIPTAKSFTKLSLYFSTYHPRENRGLERCLSATLYCLWIKLRLGL